jgi:PAS domain S-box-containing protein
MARILIVDDELSVRLLLQASLPLLGYEVAGVAVNGSEAFELAKFLIPDLVLMDIIMPGVMDGIEAAKKIRAELSIPVIFLTGFGDDEIINRAKCADPFGFLIKPCSEEGLKGAIELALHRKNQEKRLDEVLSSYREVAEAVPHTFWLRTGDYSKILYVSPSYEKMWGRSREELFKNPLDYLAAVHPDELQYVREKIESQKQGEITEEVFRIVRSDGSLRWLKDCAFPIRDERGKVFRIAGISEDITESRRVEEALRESEANMRYIVKHDPNAIAVYDLNLHYIAVSDRYLRDYNVKEEDIIGKHHYEVFPEMPQKWKEVHQRCLSGAIEGNEDDYFERPDGSITYNRWECRPWYQANGEIGGIVTYTEVTTERKKAEKALRASEEKYRSIFENCVEGIYQSTPEGRYISVNPAYAKLLGYSSPDELISSIVDIGDQIFVDPEQRLEVRRLLARDGFIKDFHAQLYRKDGTMVWVSLDAIVSVCEHNGKIPCYQGSMLDISERKRAVEALRASERFASETVDALSEHIAILDEDGLILTVNEAWRDFARKNASSLNGLIEGANYLEVCDNAHGEGADQAAEFAEGIRSMMRGEREQFVLEYSCHSPWEKRWFIGRVTRFRGEGPVRIVVAHQNITKRKRAEEALWVSEERLRLAHKAANDVIWDWEVVKDAQYWNEAGGVVFGWTDIVESPQTAAWWTDRVHPEDRQRVAEGFFAVVNDPGADRWHDEYRFRKADGTYAEVIDRAYVLRDEQGKATRLIGAMLDITECKRVEEALRESEERYRMIFNHSPLGVMHFDSNGIIREFNDKFAQIMGASREAILGFEMLERLRDPAMLRAVKDALDGRLGYYEGDYLSVTGGKSTPMRAIYQRITGQDEKILGVVGLFEDVTERKRAEEEREELEAHLHQAHKMEAIGTLAGGIAHDFNNVLSAIIGYTELSLAKAPGHSPLHADLQQVLLAAERAKDLVKQILTFSRQSEQEIKPVRIVPLLKEALKFLRSSIPSTIAIRQQIRISSESTVLADPTQIHQVIMNLCTNASYAMRRHGGTLEVELSEMVLRKDDDPTSYPELNPGQYLSLRVTDTGCGMDEGTIQRIFDPFFTTKPREEGTGMGLAVVYGIVKACGGAVTVRSKPGKGSQFYLYFPKASSPVPQPLSDSKEVSGGKGRILFVDDEAALVKLGEKMLQGLGYTVVATTSSLEALAIFRSRAEQFDLLITDYTMPQLTGLELIEEIRRIRADMPVILCSGYTDFLDRMSISDLGGPRADPQADKPACTCGSSS